MRQMLIVFSFLVLVFFCLFDREAEAVKMNTMAPDFTLKELGGVKISLSANKGKVVIINFWSTTCAPCVVELPSLSDLHREMRGEGLVVLGIALDSSEKPVRELVSKLKIDYSIMVDSKRDVYFDTYALFGQPVSLLIDRSGVLREKIFGAVEWTSPNIKVKIRSYLKGR